MKIGLTSYSLNADIMSGRKTILDAMRFAAENGAEHMEIVPFGFTLYDDGRDEFNQPLIDSIRQTAEALSLPLSDYAVLANLLAPEEEARRAEIRRLKRHIDVAHRLGVPMMRHDISSFRRPLEQNTPLAFEECLPWAVQAARELADYAAGYGLDESLFLTILRSAGRGRPVRPAGKDGTPQGFLRPAGGAPDRCGRTVPL